VAVAVDVSSRREDSPVVARLSRFPARGRAQSHGSAEKDACSPGVVAVANPNDDVAVPIAIDVPRRPHANADFPVRLVLFQSPDRARPETTGRSRIDGSSSFPFLASAGT